MGTLEDRLDQEVEGWRPEPGDKIFGKLVTVTTREGNYGRYPYLEVEQSDGSIVGVHAFHTVLKNEITQNKPRVGDTWGAKFHGKVEGKKLLNGKPVQFEKYTTVHDPQVSSPEQPDWSSIRAEGQDEASLAGIDNAFPGASEEEPF